ncbi:hypothetical protein V5O48_007488 [Marasmius crinis-equi]|uniref:Protein kinase domain-containing protein n=1 Tax=Marasmius crinis-equi TaxID=585013 RepID=A0ABR3FH53_9AGAR
MPRAQLWCIDLSSGSTDEVKRRIFSIDFEPTDTFEDLTRAISAGLHHTNKEITALDIWKLSPSIARNDARFSATTKTTYTELTEHVMTITAESGNLGEIYLDLPEDESLHLLVAVKGKPQGKCLLVKGTIELLYSELLDIKQQEQRQEHLEWLESLGSEDFEKREDVVARRHAGVDPFREIPIAILHPAFDKFLLDMNSPTLEIPPELYPLALKFSSTCWNLLSSKEVDEKQKKKTVSDLVEKMLDRPLVKRTKEGAAFDGLLQIDEVYPALLFLSEDDIGIHLMSRCRKVYNKCLLLASLDSVRKQISMPCFLLVLSGSHISVLGCANASLHPTLEYLTGFQVCTSMPSDPGVVFEGLARLFACLRRAITVLFEYYHGLPQLLEHLPKRYLPLRNTFVTPDGQVSQIEYSNLLILGNNIWTGTLKLRDNPPVPVIVKFTRHYSVAAHRLLEAASVAPKLHYWDSAPEDDAEADGEEPRLFYWRMIVMEHLKNAVTLYDFTGTSSDARQISGHLQRAVMSLHSNDYVFGDLRPTNIMVEVRYLADEVQEEGGEREVRVALVDFDWAGKAGKARYPPGISIGGAIKWPEGVKPRALITKEHDLYWLRTWLDCML